VRIARQAEEVGLDVFAIGEHHNPPFFSSSPTTLLAFISATTRKLIVSTAMTLITTNDPVRIAEEYAMLQHLSKGRMPARGQVSQPSFQKSRSSTTRPSAAKRSNDTPARFSLPPSVSLVCALQATAA
jgi:hypothetical protein